MSVQDRFEIWWYEAREPHVIEMERSGGLRRDIEILDEAGNDAYLAGYAAGAEDAERHLEWACKQLGWQPETVKASDWVRAHIRLSPSEETP